MVSFMRNWKSVPPRTVVMVVLFVSAFSLVSADRAITRGPAIGEIYYIGPTVTGEGIYHSTDFGETATCMDSISGVESICADLTPGSLFRLRMPDCLYFSNSYGQHGSWVFRTAEGDYEIESGRNEGEVFKGPGMSSNDYGFSFTQHALNGCLCSIKEFEIGNQDSIGYIIGEIYGIPDSLFLLISYDNFENLEIQYIFNLPWSNHTLLSRGTEGGELYMYKTTIYGEEKELWLSSDFGETWVLKNNFNCPNLPISGIVGGRQPGELYVLVNYTQLLGQIKHTYIYHSLDYGETFEVFHPFSHGPEPYYADFTATPLEGNAPLTVEFTDLSSGENIMNWEWDFQNDGVIDSYEQHPQYTYQDTGYYSVSLTIHPLQLDTATKYNFIHVTDGSGIGNDELEVTIDELTNYPNPFNPETRINFSIPEECNVDVTIYNIKGQVVKNLTNDRFEAGTHSLIWRGTDNEQQTCASGVYFYNFKVNGKSKSTKKCLLLK